MNLRQHPMGTASFTFALANLLMTFLMKLPCLELAVLGTIFGLLGIVGASKNSEKYSYSLSIVGLIFSILILIVCFIFVAAGNFKNVSFLALFL